MKIIIIITLIVYFFLVLKSKYRTAVSLIGAGGLLIVGSITDIYNVTEAFAKFPSEIIILVIVLALFTDNFDRLGIINYIGNKYLKMTKEKKMVIMVTMPFLIYLTSLFMNNLTVILLFSYMALYFALEYKLKIIPLLVSMVIASNIGGAALPWADTPAVILTLYTDFSLIDFLNKLFIPCLVYMIMLAGYIVINCKRHKEKVREIPFKVDKPVDWQGARMPIILFIIYIVAISVGPFYNISIAYISLLFGGILIFFDRKKPMDVLNDLPIMDSIVFLIGLFVIGGVLQYSGILDSVAHYIVNLAGSNIYLLILAVIFLAFIMATFLSAGPAASTLLPICIILTEMVPFKLIYVALALGILAGSSMFPWSATGGPILLSQVNEFLKRPKICDIREKHRISEIFSLKAYVAFSVPFSLIMLVLSYIYLCVYANIIV